MNFKRKKKLSSTSRKCFLCGSQRRQFGKKEKEKKLQKAEWKEVIGFPQMP